ncbi:MAG: ZIP family metal transporter [Candidatus Aenigmarchaeota archaeon]|nr:ZIP family metal transporter [Candidatus Aenigmarchaeota archaeon]
MEESFLLAIGSVILVSLISFVGVLVISVKERSLKKPLLYLVGFSAGALLGDAFIHLLPEAVEAGFSAEISLYILSGIIASFAVEKIVRWRHCHVPISKSHPHPFAYMNLFGDTVHNFIDGLIIGASYLASIPAGIATTIAVVFHEIPQEIGDFSVLLHGGFTKKKAVALNFIVALTAVLGAAVALFFGSLTGGSITFLVSFAAGGFVYIAAADLIPELHKKISVKSSILEIIVITTGIFVMYGLLFLK